MRSFFVTVGELFCRFSILLYLCRGQYGSNYEQGDFVRPFIHLSPPLRDVVEDPDGAESKEQRELRELLEKGFTEEDEPEMFRIGRIVTLVFSAIFLLMIGGLVLIPHIRSV